ncbi:MAG: GFA family protein [Saccharospirillaceae bacterium]|nr:GFA family protein [Pseudomonadales bacterium]NRB79000.1 GFA family protein [Saccharospirillaceae bacterium]
MIKITGSCHCARVKIQIPKNLNDVRLCYCQTCQKLSGSAFSAVSMVAAHDFIILKGQDNLTHYKSSPNKTRFHCKTCFSPIYVQLDSKPNEKRIRLGLLNEEPTVNITAHIWVSEKPDWVVINDDLPQLQEFV